MSSERTPPCRRTRLVPRRIGGRRGTGDRGRRARQALRNLRAAAPPAAADDPARAADLLPRFLGAARRDALGGARRDARARGPQRLRQVDAAAAGGGYADSHHRERRHARTPGRAAGTGQWLQCRVHRAGKRLPQRRDTRHIARRDARCASAPSRSSRISATSSTSPSRPTRAG